MCVLELYFFLFCPINYFMTPQIYLGTHWRGPNLANYWTKLPNYR